VRILYLADVRFPLERANGIQSMQTCHALAKRGHEVTMVVRTDTARPPRDPFAFYGLDPLDGLRIERVAVSGPPPMRRILYAAAASTHAGRPKRYDVVFTRDLGIAATLCRWPARFVPVVYESHGYAPAFALSLPHMLADVRPPSRRKLERLAGNESRVWAAAAGYVTITRGLLDELRQRFGNRENVRAVADGVRLAADRRFEWRPPGMVPMLTYVGHLYPWKGVDVLLHATAALNMVKVTIVGGHAGERDLARLQTLAHDLALGYRATFTGLVAPADVSAYLHAADVLVLPNTATLVSRTYTSPLKLFEYMAAGRPIIASDLPALGEVLHDQENALLVPPEDPEALASAAVRLIRDPELSERLARQAFDDVEAYSWAKRAERLEPVLERATDSTSRGA
jgi:glycosyltransferase involved in cell wall biosynthesis